MPAGLFCFPGAMHSTAVVGIFFDKPLPHPLERMGFPGLLRTDESADSWLRAGQAIPSQTGDGRVEGSFRVRELERVLDAKLRPANNRYFLLPDVPYGSAYPTYGPNGDADLDINGRAVSIEFQFGLEQLRLSSGAPARVEWSGREASIGVYQGNLPKKDKEAVQKNILDFLANASPDHDPGTEPWPAVHALVNRLLEAATPESFPGQSFTQDHQVSGTSSSRL